MHAVQPRMHRCDAWQQRGLADWARCVQLRSQLELAMRALERGQRKEDADAVEAALAAVRDSEGSAELLSDAIKAARKCVEQWQALTASDAKLQRMLREGATTQQLARAIQEASATGVKVTSAKRTLKVRDLQEPQRRVPGLTRVFGLGATPCMPLEGPAVGGSGSAQSADVQSIAQQQRGAPVATGLCRQE